MGRAGRRRAQGWRPGLTRRAPAEARGRHSSDQIATTVPRRAADADSTARLAATMSSNCRANALVGAAAQRGRGRPRRDGPRGAAPRAAQAGGGGVASSCWPAKGFSSLAEERASAPGRERPPWMVLLLDRWEGFVTAHEGYDYGRLIYEFVQLLREGPVAGLRAARRLMVARPHRRVVEHEDALLCARDDEHLIGAAAVVAPGDRLAQVWRPGRLGVAAPVCEQPVLRVRLQGEQIPDRPRLAVAAREREPRRELVLRVVPLDAKEPQVHRSLVTRRSVPHVAAAERPQRSSRRGARRSRRGRR
jgi:hypothetical protein